MALPCLAVLLLALVPAWAIFEDQAGSFDWYRSYVGPITDAQLGSKPRVFIASSQNVVGSLNLRDGSIAWRKLLDGAVDGIALVEEASLVLSLSDGKLRAFDQAEGGLRWEQQLPCASSSSCEPAFSVGTFHDSAQVAVATAQGLQVGPICAPMRRVPLCQPHTSAWGGTACLRAWGPHAWDWGPPYFIPPTSSHLQVFDGGTGELLMIKELEGFQAGDVVRLHHGSDQITVFGYTAG